MKSSPANNIWLCILGASIFCTAGVLTMIVRSLSIVSFTADATGFADIIVGAATITMSITESDGVNDGVLNLGSITATPTGNVSSAYFAANVTTDSSSGYLLSIYGDRQLVHTTNNANYFDAIGGTLMAPSNFNDGRCNKWGFALPGAQAGRYGLAPNTFGTTYSLESSAPAVNSNNWMGMPTSALPIKRINRSITNDTTQIFFGACATTDLLAGTYRGEITVEARMADPTASGEGVGGVENINVVRDTAMIPVKYTGSLATPEWQKADATNIGNDWYSYENAVWANAVTVTPATLATYRDASPGTIIPESDIRGYWVYIPRYRYQLTTPDYAGRPSTQQPFSIQFEDLRAIDYSKISKLSFQVQPMVGDFLTHPAFTFGECSAASAGTTLSSGGYCYDNGPSAIPRYTVELDGIWVGKFETSGALVSPTIMPNRTHLSNQTILDQWNTSRNVRSYHSLSRTTTDTRMARNDDWGAVTYLSSSMFGTGSSVVTRNGNTSNITGCGSSSTSNRYTGGVTCTPTSDAVNRSYYTTDGRLSSTTHNPFGVYDMSGGAGENALGNYAGIVGSSGLTSNGNGGFTQIAPKYINFYPTGATVSNCAFVDCVAQALFETDRWGGNTSYLPSSSKPWSYRGGKTLDFGGWSVIFDAEIHAGAASNRIGFRAILSNY